MNCSSRTNIPHFSKSGFWLQTLCCTSCFSLIFSALGHLPQTRVTAVPYGRLAPPNHPPAFPPPHCVRTRLRPRRPSPSPMRRPEGVMEKTHARRQGRDDGICTAMTQEHPHIGTATACCLLLHISNYVRAPHSSNSHHIILHSRVSAGTATSWCPRLQRPSGVATRDGRPPVR